MITPKQIKNIYKIEYKYFTSEYNLEKIEKNINSNKSIFSIHLFQTTFWKNQNHLILDNNLKSFIEKMNNLDEKNKIITNIKNFSFGIERKTQNKLYKLYLQIRN